MGQALKAAAATEDPNIEARLRAHYVFALLQWVGIEAATLEIPKLRQVAVHAGSGFAMVALHSLVAEIGARKGLVKSSLSSIATARELLSRFENVWQQGRLAITSTAVHLLQSDYESALLSIDEARDCGNRSGAREIRVPAVAIRALIKLAKNELEDVRSAISESITELHSDAIAIGEIGIRDVEMQLAIAEGDVDAAAITEERIGALLSEIENEDSYYELWHLVTKVKWLYGRGETEKGLAVAMDAIPHITRMSDGNLLARMKFLAAEGLGRLGDATSGAALVATAVLESNDLSLELKAEAFRVTGRLAASDDRGAAMSHFERASRILDGIGAHTAHAEVQRDALETGTSSNGISASPATGQSLPKKVGKESPPSRPHDSRTPAAPLVERIGTLISIGAHPPLLAAESMLLIAETDSVYHSAVHATHALGKERLTTYSAQGSPALVDDDPTAVRIPLGTHRDRQYEIIAIPRHTASARATLLAVEQIIHTAVAQSRALQVDRERAAPWPEPTVEQKLGLICASDRMLALVKTLTQVAGANVNVLLTGETGVGKELFARALHMASARNNRVFLPFNCSTVPRDLIDSQLFGHRRGAFTGAHDDAIGMIRGAAKGTLFLDEIGDLSLEAQPKLLRFLESGEILPLGDTKPQQVDVRIVAATNAKLDQLVSEGRFREDLYYRLNVIKINIPPLRERREEVPALVGYFMDRFGHEFQKPLLRLADETLEYLVLYRWPGNVRQLANEIRRMVAMAEPGAVLMPAHLSDDIAASRRTIPAETPSRHTSEVVTRIDQPLAAAVEHIERAAIQRALALTDGRLDDAARMLGLSRKGLYLKRQRLGL